MLAWIMYIVVASTQVNILPPPLGVCFNSDESHVVLLNVIASLLLKLAKDKYIKLFDLAAPAAEAAARKTVDDKLESYLSRPAVIQAGMTEAWVASFFLKKHPGPGPADAASGDDGDDDSE